MELLKKFENKKPEIVFEWQDEYTNAKGWLVINSLRGGAAAGGGCCVRRLLCRPDSAPASRPAAGD